MQQQAFHVDERLQIGSERATVRYIGQVSSQSGEWVGLEWDNESRGKHDGSVNGHRYFECIYAGHAGSFVRLEKLQQTARTGISVLQGLCARYQRAAGAASASQSGLVGEQSVWERQGQIQLLEKASLSGDAVSSPGPRGELAEAAPALAELDLSSTLVGSWHDALAIMQQLPALRQLDFSRTRLALPSQPAALPDSLMGIRLQTLVLNECHLSWAQVTALSSCIPELRELFLCGNGIEVLTASVESPSLQQLQVLDLTNNNISEWDEICHLGTLPSLTMLNLSSNQLHDLDAALTAGGSFSSLQALLCANNRISDWATVQSLAELPLLRDLRLSGNPLFTTGGGERFEVVARVPGLTLLNGSTVDARERRDCELHYLRGLLAQAEERPAQLQALEAEHARLAPLRQKYGGMTGTLATTAARQGGTPPMAANMLTLHLVRDTSTSEAARHSLPVPGCITLRSLKYILSRLHDVPMPWQHVSVRSPAAEKVRSLDTEDDAQTLAELAIEDDSEVQVQLQPPGEPPEFIRNIQRHMVPPQSVH